MVLVKQLLLIVRLTSNQAQLGHNYLRSMSKKFILAVQTYINRYKHKAIIDTAVALNFTIIYVTITFKQIQNNMVNT